MRPAPALDSWTGWLYNLVRCPACLEAVRWKVGLISPVLELQKSRRIAPLQWDDLEVMARLGVLDLLRESVHKVEAKSNRKTEFQQWAFEE